MKESVLGELRYVMVEYIMVFIARSAFGGLRGLMLSSVSWLACDARPAKNRRLPCSCVLWCAFAGRPAKAVAAFVPHCATAVHIGGGLRSAVLKCWKRKTARHTHGAVGCGDLRDAAA